MRHTNYYEELLIEMHTRKEMSYVYICYHIIHEHVQLLCAKNFMHIGNSPNPTTYLVHSTKLKSEESPRKAPGTWKSVNVQC